jgi:nicotinamidase-related amidase
MEQPPIPRATTAMVFNDMINANVRGRDEARTAAIEASGLIPSCVAWVAELRRLSIAIVWIRVGRRADRKDRVDVLTDAFVAAGGVPAPPTVAGSLESRNVDELPIAPEDQEVIKPRYNPFIGTDLDIQLRARRIDTILLGGISTNMGVESCARTAHDLDYHVVVLSDCCWAATDAAQQWSLTKNLPNFARVMTTTQAKTLIR